MKTQQRNFVVERKSGRRRLMLQPASIWGDIDLKALVRKAEADAPHLFEPNIAADTPSQVTELQPEPTSEPHETGDPQPPIALLMEAEQHTQSQRGDDPTSNATAQSNLDTPSPRTVKRRRVASGNCEEDDTNIAPKVRPTAAKVGTPADELILLEEENQRLKGLMAQRLRQQNAQLRKMLARFCGG